MNIESVTLAHLKVINNTYGVMVMIYLESMCGFCGGPVLKWLGSPKKLDLEVTNGAQLINLQSSSTGCHAQIHLRVIFMAKKCFSYKY